MHGVISDGHGLEVAQSGEMLAALDVPTDAADDRKGAEEESTAFDVYHGTLTSKDWNFVTCQFGVPSCLRARSASETGDLKSVWELINIEEKP